MINAPNGKEFVFKDGTKATNLKELLISIKLMPDYEFYSFVNDSKNDFANWIEFVLLDQSLSSRLRMQKDKYEIIKIIESKISESNVTANVVSNHQPMLVQESALKDSSGSINLSKTDSDHYKSHHESNHHELNNHSTSQNHSHEHKDSREKTVAEEHKNSSVTNKWYDFFKNSHPKKEPKPHVSLHYEPEQLLWIGIYALLILVIIGLLSYKLFFS